MLIKNLIPHNVNISVCFLTHSLMMVCWQPQHVAGFIALTNKVFWCRDSWFYCIKYIPRLEIWQSRWQAHKKMRPGSLILLQVIHQRITWVGVAKKGFHFSHDRSTLLAAPLQNSWVDGGSVRHISHAGYGKGLYIGY